MGQLTGPQLVASGPGGGSSIAVIVAHLAGNMQSRFTEFLTTDGEKPWRDREGEFTPSEIGWQALLELWASGWEALLGALGGLTDSDLSRTVTIRGRPLTVHGALHRSLAHAGYHVGQIVYLAKSMRGPAWVSLSIPPGGSDAYNRNPTHEQARVHAAELTRRPGEGAGG